MIKLQLLMTTHKSSCMAIFEIAHINIYYRNVSVLCSGYSKSGHHSLFLMKLPVYDSVKITQRTEN